jgi:hypothetical protein
MFHVPLNSDPTANITDERFRCQIIPLENCKTLPRRFDGSHISSLLPPEYSILRIELIAVIAKPENGLFPLVFRRHAIYLVLVGGIRARHRAAGTPGLLSDPINIIYLIG